MWKRYPFLENLNENGAKTRLWTTLSASASQYLQENISKYFKLKDLCQTMILGSLEDERIFSALSFLKSKLKNNLDKHVDTCLYVTKYDIDNFPYERALTLWRSDYDRRGEKNITNISNELDIEHNVLEAHNDIHLEKIMFTI